MKFVICIEAGSATFRRILGTTGEIRKLLAVRGVPTKKQKEFVRELLGFTPAKVVLPGDAIIQGVREA